MKKEKIFFPILVVLILVGIAGIPTVRYALYLAPVIAVLIMLVTGDFKFQFPPSVQPFILLLIFCIFTIYRADYNWARQTYFILAYTTIFVFYDFSNIKVNIKLFNLLFIAVFLVKAVLAGQFGVFALSQISLIDSKSALESTLAFPLGLFAIFFLYKKNYLWFLLNVVIVVLAFKRVVLFGVVACVLLFFIPRRIRAVLLSPYIITTAILLGVVFQLTLAVGEFDSFIKDAFGISTNHLLMGRQELWQRAIDFTDFEFWSFSYYGVGHGTLTNFLEGSYSMKRVLLHNDFLLILFENGLACLVLFAFLLLRHESHVNKAMALYLVVLFASDNVLIYQHVMIPYLLLMNLGASARASTLSRGRRKTSNHKGRTANTRADTKEAGLSV